MLRKASVLGLLVLVPSFVVAEGCGGTSGANDGASTGGREADEHEGGSSSGGNGSGGKKATGGSAGGGAATGGTGGSSTGGEGGVGNDLCGDEEVCDSLGLGLDEDCDGKVDDGCDCVAGTAQACFLGDPAKLALPTCMPGKQLCGEDGKWGDCKGGVHDIGDECGGSADCGALASVPFAPVDLSKKLAGWASGSGTFTVTCPEGFTCPAVSGKTFRPIGSGEYEVTYVEGDKTCKFPLVVRTRGIRIELSWEQNVAPIGDLDLRVHQPGSTDPWGGVSAGTSSDCMWQNCVAGSIGNNNAPKWYPETATFPEPVRWYKGSTNEENTCYFSPRGNGAIWKGLDKGCYSPRLDTDTIDCDASVTNVDASNYCAPENINIDFPNEEWTRVGVHYFSSGGRTTDAHPKVRVFCDGALAAELGAEGFDAPVAFTPAQGVQGGVDSNVLWLVADVRYLLDGDRGYCEVVPLYGNPETHTPLFTTATATAADFVPPYPAP